MRYDAEYALVLSAKAYAESKLDAIDFEQWPLVTMFDPMAVDAGNRVAFICQSGQSMAESVGNFSFELEVGVRTDWTQPTVETDLSNHFDRVNQVRDVFNQDTVTLCDEMTALAPSGFKINYIEQQRKFTTDVNEASYYSAITLAVRCYAED